jgi:hypothetical protein
VEIQLYLLQQHRKRNLNRMFGKGSPVHCQLEIEMADIAHQRGTTDWLSIAWDTHLTQGELFDLSRKWIAQNVYLLVNMDGISSLGQSNFIITPLDTSASVQPEED